MPVLIFGFIPLSHSILIRPGCLRHTRQKPVLRRDALRRGQRRRRLGAQAAYRT